MKNKLGKLYLTFTDLLHRAWLPVGQPFPYGTNLIISNGEWVTDSDSYCIETMDYVHTVKKNTGIYSFVNSKKEKKNQTLL